MHYNQARKNFRDWISLGNKLTYEQIRNMKDETLKVDYISQQLINDDIM